jgi:hypothetical protein
MIKRTFSCCLIITLILIQLTTYAVSASPGVALFDVFLDIIYENVPSMQFLEKNCYSIRAVYSISLPEDTSEVHKLIVSEYSSYQFVYLIEYGYAYIGPIIQSSYVCIGEDNGNFVILDTPYDIISKVFDYTIFNDIPIIEVINTKEALP